MWLLVLLAVAGAVFVFVSRSRKEAVAEKARADKLLDGSKLDD